jgi:hypothetical protein
LIITARTRFDPVPLGVQLAYELRRLHPKAWDPARYDTLLANRRVFALVRDGAEPAEVLAAIGTGRSAFETRRTRFLLYR